MKRFIGLEQRERLILTVIFLVIFSLLIIDIWEDLSSGASLTHVAFEAVILALTMVGVIIQWFIYFNQKRDIKNLNINLDMARHDLNLYKSESKKFIEGLSQQIDDQLTQWKLSKAEKEIALLILKGLNNKEIAGIRNTSEKTVRQQVTAVLQKSKLSSRLELSAFFLEDLLIAPT